MKQNGPKKVIGVLTFDFIMEFFFVVTFPVILSKLTVLLALFLGLSYISTDIKHDVSTVFSVFCLQSQANMVQTMYMLKHKVKR